MDVHAVNSEVTLLSSHKHRHLAENGIFLEVWLVRTETDRLNAQGSPYKPPCNPTQKSIAALAYPTFV